MKKRTFKTIVARIAELTNEYKELSESLDKDLVMYGPEYSKTFAFAIAKLRLAGINFHISILESEVTRFKAAKKVITTNIIEPRYHEHR